MKKIIKLLILILLIFLLSISVVYASSPSITRLSGLDRYETAVDIAKAGWNQSDYCILVSGESYPDALVATPLAKKYDAPILLTTVNSLPDVTKQTLVDLKVKTVQIIGGDGVISTNIESELQSMNITINRIFGNDRYETAIKIAEQISSPTELFVVIGEDYPDGLSISPIAALKQFPIILVQTDCISDSVKNYINLSLTKITKTYVIGYSDIISDNVANQFPNVERIVGADKYARNISINKKFENIFSINNICIATGEGFADSLVGSAYASKISAPIILVNNATPYNTKTYYQQKLTNTSIITIFGGIGVIPDSVVQNLGCLNPSPPVNSNPSSIVSPSIVVTPTISGKPTIDLEAENTRHNKVLNSLKNDYDNNRIKIFHEGQLKMLKERPIYNGTDEQFKLEINEFNIRIKAIIDRIGNFTNDDELNEIVNKSQSLNDSYTVKKTIEYHINKLERLKNIYEEKVKKENDLYQSNISQIF
jgi:putative cell wall-binding protein